MLGGRQEGRTRFLTALVALVVLATASACSGVGPIGRSGGGGGKAAAKPVITPRQARSVVMHLQSRRVAAFASENLTALKSIDSDPQLSVDRGDIRTAQSKDVPISDAPYLAVTPLVPKQTVYPAWFMAVIRDRSGHALDLLEKQSSNQAWHLVAETGLSDGSIPWKKTQGGWAVSATIESDPSRALAAYWTRQIDGADVSGVPVAAGEWTSGVASQIASAISSNKAHDWAQIALFAADGPLTPGLQLANGRSLGFAWVTETLKTRDAFGYCFSQPGANGFQWDPLVPNGNYLEVEVTYTRLEAMSVPVNGPMAGLSYEDGTIGAGGTQCPS